MQKIAIKAFVYSFSVSLLAIATANRVFCYEPLKDESPLKISGKNIVLFLKNSDVAKLPIKKITLNTLPDIEKQVETPPLPEPDVILANSLEEIDFPLEIVDEAFPEQKKKDIVLNDVLYAPNKPLEQPKIEAAPIYLPENAPENLVANQLQKKKIIYNAEITGQKQLADKEIKHRNDALLKSARAETPTLIPLQKRASAPNPKNIKIGNPTDLNHVAMDRINIPIQSMEKQLETEHLKTNAKENNWETMRDSPWVVAKSSGGKNLLAKEEFSSKSSEEISELLNTSSNRQEIKLASETVKNLIIPIPDDILKDKNLTPKLAYPSTSEDAKKEKIIEENIKKEEIKANLEQELLSPIEEDISLDAPDMPPMQEENSPTPSIAQDDVSPKESITETKSETITGNLGSIFTKSPKDINEAKEQAIAKAKIKRSLKSHLAKSKPVSIMPTEIRLSFQPNRAEISGQTLRWVQAFAAKAAETPDISLEIRIDGTNSMELQQKRLNLLHNILTNKGVNYDKINTVFTAREPNSFILRTVSHKKSGGTTDKIKNASKSNYIQW